jgi:hypothetical protein
MTKEVWITVATVTNTESLQVGKAEYQFSDGPPSKSGSSAYYISLQKGLKDHSGCVIHWVGEMKKYFVTVDVREVRTNTGRVTVMATSPEEAVKAARASKFDDFNEINSECDDWDVTDAHDATEAE